MSPGQFLRPDAAKAIVEHEFDTDHLNVYVTFRFSMDVTATPPLNLWLCEVDDVPKAATAQAWQDAWTLLLTIDAVAARPTKVTLEYDGPDDSLIITWGKQWEPWGPIVSVEIPVATGYVRNPVIAGWDFSEAHFTEDGGWHDLDLSAIIPTGTKAIHIIGRIKNAFTQKGFHMGHPVDQPLGRYQSTYTLSAVIRHGFIFIVSCDENRIIRYLFSAGGWTEDRIKIMGWWL